MNSSIRNLILGILIIGLIGGGVGLYLYNKPHADLAAQTADISLSSDALFAAFEADEASANTTYLDKLVAVKGSLAEITSTQDGGAIYILRADDAMFGVNCAFLPDQLPANPPEVGAEVEIKGLVIGMNMDVNLSRCVLVK